MSWDFIPIRPDETRAYVCGKSLRIRIPDTSLMYMGYTFFHPLKLCVFSGGECILRIPEGWVFKLSKREKVDNEWKTVETIEIDTQELKAVMRIKPYLHTPPQLEPLECSTINQELLDD